MHISLHYIFPHNFSSMPEPPFLLHFPLSIMKTIGQHPNINTKLTKAYALLNLSVVAFVWILCVLAYNDLKGNSQEYLEYIDINLLLLHVSTVNVTGMCI